MITIKAIIPLRFITTIRKKGGTMKRMWKITLGIVGGLLLLTAVTARLHYGNKNKAEFLRLSTEISTTGNTAHGLATEMAGESDLTKKLALAKKRLKVIKKRNKLILARNELTTIDIVTIATDKDQKVIDKLEEQIEAETAAP